MKSYYLVQNIKELRRVSFSRIPERVKPKGVLMCTPDHFTVQDEKNKFMEGNIGKVDFSRACNQWKNLNNALHSRGVGVDVIEGAFGLEDMVFAANCGISWMKNGENTPHFLASRMKYPSRQKEIPFYEQWFSQKGYKIEEISDNEGGFFEGEGDAMWYPQKMLLIAGYGHRTTIDFLAKISKKLSLPVVVFELISDYFYHLDTCLSILDDRTCIFCPPAFSEESQEMIRYLFPESIEISTKEGVEFMSGNCYVYQRTGDVFIQKGNPGLVDKIREKGKNVFEVDLSEFIKSGGNVKCLLKDIY